MDKTPEQNADLSAKAGEAMQPVYKADTDDVHTLDGYPNSKARQHLHFIHSQQALTTATLHKALHMLVFQNSQTAWSNFAKLLFLSLGVGSFVVGMIFFFAYNWADLHRLAKFAIAQSAFIILLVAVLVTGRAKVSSINELYKKQLVKNICLTGLAMLVGMLFALFGQVYQSTADSYTLFVAWVVCISPWVFVARFVPLWTLWLVLLNIAINTFLNQSYHTTDMAMCSILVLLNGSVASYGFLALQKQKQQASKYNQKSAESTDEVNADSLKKPVFIQQATTPVDNAAKIIPEIPSWFVKGTIFVSVGYATFGSGMALHDLFGRYSGAYEPLASLCILFITAIGYYFALKQAHKHKYLFLPAVIYFSMMIIGCFGFFSIMDGAETILLLVFFIIVCITITISKLKELRIQWFFNTDNAGTTNSAQQEQNIENKSSADNDNHNQALPIASTEQQAQQQLQQQQSLNLIQDKRLESVLEASVKADLDAFANTLQQVNRMQTNSMPLNAKKMTNAETDDYIKSYHQQLYSHSLMMAVISFFGGMFAALMLIVFLFIVVFSSDTSLFGYLVCSAMLLAATVFSQLSESGSHFDGASCSFYAVAMGLIYFAVIEAQNIFYYSNSFNNNIVACLLVLIISIALLSFMRTKLLRFISFSSIYINAILLSLLVFHHYVLGQDYKMREVFTEYLAGFSWLWLFALICIGLMILSINILLREDKLLTLNVSHKFKHYTNIQGYNQPFKLATLLTFVSSVWIFSELERRASLTLYDWFCNAGWSFTGIGSSVFLTAAIIAMIVFLLSNFYKKYNIINQKQYRLLLVSLPLALLLTFSYPTIAMSILLLLVAYYVNDKLMLSLSVVMLFIAISQYYYNLNTTLLMKAVAMMISGLFFIIIYQVINRMGNQDVAIDSEAFAE